MQISTKFLKKYSISAGITEYKSKPQCDIILPMIKLLLTIIQASNDVEKGDPQIPSVGIKLSTIVIKNSTVAPQRVNHRIHRILESPYWVCIQEK